MVRAVFLYRRDVMGRGMAATDIERGLSTAEVEERIAAGKINRNMELKTKSVKELIIENLCTLFNLINVILAFLVILTGSFKNLTFLFVVFLNTAIGVIQSMRSKKMVDKLTLLTSKKAIAVRDGAEVELDLDQIVLDDIIYHGAKKYEEQIDSMQLRWAAAYAERLPAGSRVCIAMHAPAMKSWLGNRVMESAIPLMDAFAAHDLHFITGHTHLNSNFDIREGVMEHNVAQVCGNLWWDPINWDGTPKGYQLFRECGGEFSWEYRTLGEYPARQLRVWRPGEVEKRPDCAVAKVWNWDSYWTVVWYEDGRYRGAMQRTQLEDPDYTAHLDSLKAAGKKLAKPQRPRTTNFYFTARPSASAREIEVVATDRFGRRYSERIPLGNNL